MRHSRAMCSVAVLALLVGTGIELPDKIDRSQTVADDIAAEDKTIDDAVGAGPAVVGLPITPDGPDVRAPRGGAAPLCSAETQPLSAGHRAKRSHPVLGAAVGQGALGLEMEGLDRPACYAPVRSWSGNLSGGIMSLLAGGL